jgi:hypothetical protein
VYARGKIVSHLFGLIDQSKFKNNKKIRLNYSPILNLFIFSFSFIFNNQPVIKCVQDSFYKISSDALLVSQQLARILKSALNANLECLQYVNDLYAATLARLKQTDIDQEVKERAIVCT